ncbi:MAG: NADH-quinone oxidoreductase subunit J, partial [Lachnospiraceae bacterium]|nr:NADH-quinone oxidoreductase subunit J [Lachnospiraceae bacterium]
VKESREYRKVPEGRLLARLGLGKYDKPAPLDDMIKETMEVKIRLLQHIGAPAVACVKEGEQVQCGDLIAKAAEGLSVNIHASVSGTVQEVTKEAILIKKVI